MTMIRKEIQVPAPIDEAFAYVADFATTAEWDPGIAEARRVDQGELGVGTRFEVVADFNGRKLPLTYEMTAFDAPGRIVLTGEGSTFHGEDEILFASTPDGGTHITYVADINLKGIAKLAQPFMKGRFEEMGDKAVAGLRRVLTERHGQPSSA
jgi:carbon monoxide dehydrogenase subunit G